MKKPPMIDAVTLVYALVTFSNEKLRFSKNGFFTRVERVLPDGDDEMICWLDNSMTQTLIQCGVIAAGDILKENGNG